MILSFPYLNIRSYSEYIVGDANNGSCDLTRGSVVQLVTAPTDNSPTGIANVLYSYDPQDGSPVCAQGTQVYVSPQDLVEMNNDFRAKVQEGLSVTDNGQTVMQRIGN